MVKCDEYINGWSFCESCELWHNESKSYCDTCIKNITNTLNEK